jgi:hypothetical protein
LSSSGETKSKHYSTLQQILIKLQDINDEKIRYNQALSELIETRFRAVERDFQNNVTSKPERTQSPITTTARNASVVQQVLSVLPLKNSSTTASNASSSTSNPPSEHNTNGNERGTKRMRRTRTDAIAELERAETPIKSERESSTRNSTSAQSSSQSTTVAKTKGTTSSKIANKKKKKNASGKQATSSTGSSTTTAVQQSSLVVEPATTFHDEVIDPDEETYCLCGQISYGEMILCENDACKIEWFHFSCVGLSSKPKGRWFCPACRGVSEQINK